MLLLTEFAGFAFSPPQINNPTPLQGCDVNNNGTGIVDLTPKISEVLGALNPSLYTVTFHDSFVDANNGASPLTAVNAFFGNNGQVVFIRVEDNAVPEDFSVATLELQFLSIPTASIIAEPTVCPGDPVMVTFTGDNGTEPYIFSVSVNGGAISNLWTFNQNYTELQILDTTPGSFDIVLSRVQSWGSPGCFQNLNETFHIDILAPPTTANPIDLLVEDIPYDGSAVFDLTVNTPLLMNGDPTLTITYYETLVDAEAGTSPLVAPASYVGTNGQTIWVAISNNTCSIIKSFKLYTTNPDIVFIPDANFKNILVTANNENQAAQDLIHNFTIIDANDDGEIQYSEAENISYLSLAQANIADLTGIEAFINLMYLNCGYNSQLTTINTSTLPLLENISTSHCALSTLDLTNNHNLKMINCEYNNLSSLDFSQSPLMTFIRCQNNNLNSINLTGLTLLDDLWVSNNHLTALNTTDLDSIRVLNLGTNSITSLSLAGLGLLQDLNCEENQIDSLDTSDCPNLTSLECAANQMTYLEVSQSPLLFTLNCSMNTLQSLDLSSLHNLCEFNCAGNNTMNYLNIKNGVDSCYVNYNVNFIQNSTQFLCCDDNEVAYFKNYFQFNGINVNINSYCSFTPGGDYNTIFVNTLYDSTGNGCDVNDGGFPNVRLNINDQTNSGAAFTGVNGSAQFFTQAGSFLITPSVENPTWFSISPPTVTVPFSNINNNSATPNFCIAPNGIHPDLEIVIAPLTTARPGFNADYKIVIRNKGNQIQSQLNGINLSYDSEKMDFLLAGETPSSIGVGTLSWDFANLSPFESKSIYVSMRVHAPTDIPNEVNIGDVLTFNATINPIAGDENPSDNTFQFNQTVVGSFDPNEIVCLEGNIVSPIEIGNYLHYVINFENTGTADAENIVVREVIDATQFDVSSLQLLNSSASVTTRLMGNVAEFIFPSINLHSGGHGNILLKIRSNSTLVSGDTVSKKANIYFDYNFPVETLPEDTLFQSLSNPEVGVDASISVYPNPTKGNININCSNTIKSVQLYDVQGRILQTSLVNETQTSIDISNQSKGVYFLKVTSDKGIGVQKIVRE